jgi:predicted extracellular nuclease
MKSFICHSTAKLLIAIFFSLIILNNGMAIEMPTKLRVATFNVSMEALNYAEEIKGHTPHISGSELTHALQNDHQQIKNIAEIIQRVNPDIILLNEFDRVDDNASNIRYFIDTIKFI